MWIYSQSSGDLWGPSGKLVAKGYSGNGEGKNNPAMQHIRNVGPIPRGDWVIGEPYDSNNIGPFALPLYPNGHDADGRTYFRIHGDSRSNPGEASKGCVIFNRPIRDEIYHSTERLFRVIE